MSFVFESAEAFSAGMVLNHITAAMQPALYSSKESSSCHYDREDQGAEKKRRLTVEQAKSLERSFEREKKLEHERKMQLAFELGLKPRQVAVWYQNRRARWKAKQLEQDYDILKEQYQRMLLEKQKLEGEVIRLTAEVRLAERQMAERPMKEENITSGCSYGTKEEEENGEKRSSSVRSDGASKPCIGQAVAEPDHGTRLLQCHMSQTPVSSEDVEQSERNSYQQIVAKSGDNNDNIVSQQFYESDLMSLDGQQGMTAAYFDWFNF